MKVIVGRRACGCIRSLDADVNPKNLEDMKSRGYRAEIVTVNLDEKDLGILLDRECRHKAAPVAA